MKIFIYLLALHDCATLSCIIFGKYTLFVIVSVMLGFLIMFVFYNKQCESFVKFEMYRTFSEKHVDVI